jgi:hypothetical protein
MEVAWVKEDRIPRALDRHQPLRILQALQAVESDA